jgi:hypothetical protein
MKTLIEMAQEVRLLSTEANQHGIYFEALEHFAELVRADEREARAQFFDNISSDGYPEMMSSDRVAEILRAGKG